MTGERKAIKPSSTSSPDSRSVTIQDVTTYRYDIDRTHTEHEHNFLLATQIREGQIAMISLDKQIGIPSPAISPRGKIVNFVESNKKHFIFEFKPKKLDSKSAEDNQTLMQKVDLAERAAAQMVSKYLDQALKIAFTQAKNQRLIQLMDFIQVGNIGLMEAVSRFDPARDKNFMSFAGVVIRNKMIDIIRAESRAKKHIDPNSQDLLSDQEQFDIPDASNFETESIENIYLAEISIEIKNAIKKLPPEQEQALSLTYYSSDIQQKIAADLGISLGTFKSRLRMGLEKLRTDKELMQKISA